MSEDRPDGPPEAVRSRPETEDSYGIPAGEDGMLPWTFVEETLESARNVWVTTVRPDGLPHARPTWGVWVDGTFFCGGGERTRWIRNLVVDPSIAVHTESAESVVIVEGEAERIDEETGSSALVERLDDAYEEKYDVRHGTPFFAVRPDLVLAWTDYPEDATRWQFEGRPPA